MIQFEEYMLEEGDNFTIHDWLSSPKDFVFSDKDYVYGVMFEENKIVSRKGDSLFYYLAQLDQVMNAYPEIKKIINLHLSLLNNEHDTEIHLGIHTKRKCVLPPVSVEQNGLSPRNFL